MILVGLTGGIGSGKTTIAGIFKIFNIPVFNTDIVAKQLMATDELVHKQIIDAFGEDAYLHNNELNKTYLSNQVFNSEKQLQTLNNIVHPVVRNYFEQWITRQNSRYIICESAILIESGFFRRFDKIICVIADEIVRISRVMKREQVDEKTVRERMANQITDEERLKYADYVIYNNDNDMVVEQILEIDKKLWENSQNG